MSGPRMTVDMSGLERRFGERVTRAKQEAFAKRVATEIRAYVPLDSGALRDSDPLHSIYASGDIMWTTPYARRVYHLKRVLRVKNPKASPRWAEVAKNERMGAWRAFAKKLLGQR